jgi:hypothetical protein
MLTAKTISLIIFVLIELEKFWGKLFCLQNKSKILGVREVASGAAFA